VPKTPGLLYIIGKCRNEQKFSLLLETFCKLGAVTGFNDFDTLFGNNPQAAI
jgi:hypothetical protein